MSVPEPAAPRPSAPRRRNPRGEGGLLKGEIIRAAMRILDRTPNAVLSLRMVAKEAGIAAPSIYPHFSDVDVLMADIVRECWQQLGDEMTRAAETCVGGNPLTTLKVQLSAYIRYAMERPSRYKLLFALPQLEVEVLRHLPGMVQPAYRNIAGTLEHYQATGRSLPWGNTLEVAIFILSLAHGRVALAQTAPHRRGNSPAWVESFVLETIDRVFTAPSG